MLDFISEKTTCWERLKNAKKPIFLYGMGNGARKILDVFGEYGIPCAGIFASDEFVRGHSFAGYRVHTLSQVEETLCDFIIVLAFAAGYPELYEKINALAKRHELYAPDLPVAGGGLFTAEYCWKNAALFEKVYALLADETSRRTYADVINFKISGNISYLNRCTSPRSEVYGEIIKLPDNAVCADLGAYNGDTVEEFIVASKGRFKAIYAFEPNPYNFRRLVKNTGGGERIRLFNGAAWSENGFISFTAGEGRMTKVSAQGEKTVPCRALDDTVKENADIIKLDVEGAEREALMGAKRHIQSGAAVICSLYHRNGDLFELPLLIHEMNPRLRLFIRHHPYIPAWETNLYAAP